MLISLFVWTCSFLAKNISKNVVLHSLKLHNHWHNSYFTFMHEIDIKLQDLAWRMHDFAFYFCFKKRSWLFEIEGKALKLNFCHFMWGIQFEDQSKSSMKLVLFHHQDACKQTRHQGIIGIIDTRQCSCWRCA